MGLFLATDGIVHTLGRRSLEVLEAAKGARFDSPGVITLRKHREWSFQYRKKTKKVHEKLKSERRERKERENRSQHCQEALRHDRKHIRQTPHLNRAKRRVI